MNFNIVTGNHDGPQIDDYVLLLKLTAEAAGHEVNHPHLLDSYIIIIENFSKPWVECLGSQARNACIIVATEMITGDTFNDFDFHHPHYANKGYWQDRYDLFLDAAQFAKAIWLCTSDPKQLELYREKTRKPVVELKTPFFKEFMPPTKQPARADLFFSGSMTNYRRATLDAIRAANPYARLWLSDITSQFNRSEKLARSRYALDIRLGEEYAQISALRVWYQLMCGVPTICQTPAREQYLLPYVLHSTDLPTMCNNVLAANVTGEDLVQKFRDETNAKEESRRVMEETFG